MTQSNETITIQIGNSANYVSSHLWNSRYEFYNEEHEPSSTLYHSSSYSSSNKHYPRCVIVESSANLRSFDTLHQKIFPSSRSIFSHDVNSITDCIPWTGKIQTSYHSSSTDSCAATSDLSNEDKDKQYSWFVDNIY